MRYYFDANKFTRACLKCDSMMKRVDPREIYLHVKQNDGKEIIFENCENRGAFKEDEGTDLFIKTFD